MALENNSSILAQDPAGAMKSGGTTPPLTGTGKVVCVTGASGQILNLLFNRCQNVL